MSSKNFRQNFQNLGKKCWSFFFYVLFTLFIRNNFKRTQGLDFAQSLGKIKNNLRAFEDETLKIWQKAEKYIDLR